VIRSGIPRLPAASLAGAGAAVAGGPGRLGGGGGSRQGLIRACRPSSERRGVSASRTWRRWWWRGSASGRAVAAAVAGRGGGGAGGRGGGRGRARLHRQRSDRSRGLRCRPACRSQLGQRPVLAPAARRAEMALLFVLPGARRAAVLPWPACSAGGPTEAEIEAGGAASRPIAARCPGSRAGPREPRPAAERWCGGGQVAAERNTAASGQGASRDPLHEPPSGRRVGWWSPVAGAVAAGEESGWRRPRATDAGHRWRLRARDGTERWSWMGSAGWLRGAALAFRAGSSVGCQPAARPAAGRTTGHAALRTDCRRVPPALRIAALPAAPPAPCGGRRRCLRAHETGA
jgi:hypothetical protein